MTVKSWLSAILSGLAFASLPVAGLAQSEPKDIRETAKPADTVSPFGVSYTTGSFTYSVPLFTIGYGEWPNRLAVSLNYDSSGARYPNKAWTLSIERRTSGQFARYAAGFQGDPQEELHEYAMNLVLGNGSHTFELGPRDFSSGNLVSVSEDGSRVTFVAGTAGAYRGLSYSKHGRFEVTGRDGSQVSVEGGLRTHGGELHFSSGPIVTLPSGHVMRYSEPSLWDGAVFPETSSTGLLVRRYGAQICAFNTAYIDPASISSCADSSLVATIEESSTGGVKSVTRPDGGVYQFEYQRYHSRSQSPDKQSWKERTRWHLSCVKEPGQSKCSVRNTYSPCDGPGWVFGNPDVFGKGSWSTEDAEWTGSRDRVISQTLGDGRAVTYTYTGTVGGSTSSGGCREISSVKMAESGAITTIELAKQPGSRVEARVVSAVIDPLGRKTLYGWTGANPAALFLGRDHLLSSITAPGGQVTDLTYDRRGNRVEMRLKAKPDSRQPDIVVRATYPANCSNSKICNQPSAITDANGNTTQYTYDAIHGGVVTAVGPQVNGISPATKFSYVQREARLRRGNSYRKTGQPIWLLSEERSCQKSALNLSNGNCEAGAADQIRKTYDYGPDQGPNNLWLRGVTLIADGKSLRTCYSYDRFGRRISETQPKAGLTSCP